MRGQGFGLRLVVWYISLFAATMLIPTMAIATMSIAIVLTPAVRKE